MSNLQYEIFCLSLSHRKSEPDDPKISQPITTTPMAANPSHAALMSPRTAKYVAAMIREGDNFNFAEWLKRVRGEEAEAKRAAGTSGELAATVIDKPISTPADQRVRTNPALRLIAETIRTPRALRRPHRQAKSRTPNARLRRWLEKVHCAWCDFQGSRRRDAVYSYLEAAFAIVAHYRIRRRTKRLQRHALEFANLPFDKQVDPFVAVIKGTSGGEVDNKMISKWSRALRYVARSKEPDSRVRTFMKEASGINGCAKLYAKHFGRGRQR